MRLSARSSRLHFNPRPPRGGRRRSWRSCPGENINFNPRPPARGATPCLTILLNDFKFQSTPPARGATRRLDTKLRLHRDFNPRPREGGDVRTYEGSTSNCISIHAPREGATSASIRPLSGSIHFNPRPPRGGRHHIYDQLRYVCIFQSTPPARGATLHGSDMPAN